MIFLVLYFHQQVLVNLFFIGLGMSFLKKIKRYNNLEMHQIQKNKFRTTLILTMVVIGSIQSQTLQQYIDEAIENHPDLKAKTFEIDLTNKKEIEVASLSDLKLTAGYFVSGAQTRTGEQQASFGMQQSLPWFGTRKAKKGTIEATRAILSKKLEVQKRWIGLQVAKTYYDLYALKAKEQLLIEHDTLLKSYKKIALQAIEADKGSLVKVLKLDMAYNDLQFRKEQIKGDILNKESRMNQLLHRDGFDELYIPKNLFIPEEEPTMLLDDITYHPALEVFDLQQEVWGQKEKANKREAAPEIGLGVDYVVINERTDILVPDNGKDIIMPKMSLSLPLFSNKHKARNAQYEIQNEIAQQQREAAQNHLEEQMEEAVNNRITARIAYDTQQKNIDKAKHLNDVLLKEYEIGKTQMEALLEIQEMLLQLESKKIDAIADYFGQTSILNYLR